MCSMEFNSEFKATWDGQFMKAEEGELRIPIELKEYIHYPINMIEIEAQPGNQVIGESQAKPRFVTDTLRLNKMYNLEGEIIGINKARPVVQVRINN
jgi:hypothetical protein